MDEDIHGTLLLPDKGFGSRVAAFQASETCHLILQLSICRDILEVDPANRQARISLVFALTDEIHEESGAFASAMEAMSGLETEYDRTYYPGIAWERRAKASYAAGGVGRGGYIYDWTVRALHLFGAAEHLRPAGNDDAILRWNACVRFLDRHKELGPKTEEAPEPILSE